MSLLGLTLLLKDFALILLSSWGEQKSLKQAKIIGKIGGEICFFTGVGAPGSNNLVEEDGVCNSMKQFGGEGCL